MTSFASRQWVREAMAAHGLATRKRFGQHFLVDPFVLDKVIEGAGIESGDVVLEIGPGLGALTQALAKKAGHVLAVEIDRTLARVLREVFAGEPVTVVEGDILKTDLAELVRPYGHLRKKAVANLPYYITTPALFNLLEGNVKFDSITVMVQKEVANRMAAKPRTKDYGALTLAVGFYADVSLIANVPVNCFMPRPAVDSAVVKLDVQSEPMVGADRDAFFRLVKAAFGKRRKTLANCLDGYGKSKAELELLFESAGIGKNARGEELDIHAFGRLAEALRK